ncbi:MAG: glycosyl hydrolase family 32 [Pseudozobellia sp.]|nr:glycosyl hydrolase family 32 [Pseudozobellia sp.]MBG49903.1 glycosyl hydrolase family 32 [Pseudozobellia sp.]MBG50024.1 glycosyl hydrolase family 32 [Pseudozobellia sp.]|tara:strand:- start:2372 stop:3937 length:1566 start_codon:yes stop_codon:yes gene_type:complete
MWPKTLSLLLLIIVLGVSSCKEEKQRTSENNSIRNLNYMEPYRPQFHFSPDSMWMNDPNGMVYHQGKYHLFYQFYPDSTVWGPMHWGHAVSEDLIHWKHNPIALYPDELGYIFSGSAVLDKKNSSGFGTESNPPLVAIYTYHDPEGEKSGKNNFQTQGLAFSLDNGESWTKYQDNPIIANTEDIRDFRDPKVMWHEESSSWVMTLVAGDHAQFYRSVDLKNWELSGEFGKHVGAHGGVWECPDLFKMKVQGSDEEKWVLLISINPGAPNGGSGTQYFVGDFDGETFVTDQTEHKWVDWGTDNYAGVTYSNTPEEKRIFLGWMSNWAYAQSTPTDRWRSAMTVPRELSLYKNNEGVELYSYPIDQFNDILSKASSKSIEIEPGAKEVFDYDDLNQSEVRFETNPNEFTMELGNSLGESLILEFKKDTLRLNRSNSGKTDFEKAFGEIVQKMPMPHLDSIFEVRMILDWSSIEIFIDKGKYVITSQIFPNENYGQLSFENKSNQILSVQNLEVSEVKRTWHTN